MASGNLIFSRHDPYFLTKEKQGKTKLTGITGGMEMRAKDSGSNPSIPLKLVTKMPLNSLSVAPQEYEDFSLIFTSSNT